MAPKYEADVYVEARPHYPEEWYSWLAARTLHHSLAWDVGTGNGQAATAVAEHYEQVIATDVSEQQLQRAIPHPRIKYLHTPISMSEDDIVNLIGGENSVDLVTVATAVHWFDLPSFYAAVTRLLKKPGGIIAVWSYYNVSVSPTVDPLLKRYFEAARPYFHPNVKYPADGYKTLPFPFESVGLGSEGEPLPVDIPKQLSFAGFLGLLRSSSAFTAAKERGVELLSGEVVEELEVAWGGSNLTRCVVFKAFMLAGKVRL
ncbi:hypothetical protein Nepgr_013220 [Nepenthes gracilis]|uniref:Methyltransferase type 11 domain-containing protein n=1 Tax=Nepenthes gracilis TaxID=150966 RepID=A0AAD3SIK5_NEPGR|nr:hypothetical protein Nepgr_013220 [Nepenthes gracilis]